nr:unnamed protein product [Callosobruchus chinensis]
MGDVNVNFLDKDSPSTKCFKSMLDALDITQIIEEPTNIASQSFSLIDVVLCNNMDLIESAAVNISEFSLHECISCTIKRIYVDSKLRWNVHIDETAKKLTKNILLLRNLSSELSSDALKSIYFFYVTPSYSTEKCYGDKLQTGRDCLHCREKRCG